MNASTIPSNIHCAFVWLVRGNIAFSANRRLQHSAVRCMSGVVLNSRAIDNVSVSSPTWISGTYPDLSSASSHTLDPLPVLLEFPLQPLRILLLFLSGLEPVEILRRLLPLLEFLCRGLRLFQPCRTSTPTSGNSNESIIIRNAPCLFEGSGASRFHGGELREIAVDGCL